MINKFINDLHGSKKILIITDCTSEYVSEYIFNKISQKYNLNPYNLLDSFYNFTEMADFTFTVENTDFICLCINNTSNGKYNRIILKSDLVINISNNKLKLLKSRYHNSNEEYINIDLMPFTISYKINKIVNIIRSKKNIYI